MDFAASMVTDRGLSAPEASPLQPVKTAPVSGLAVALVQFNEFPALVRQAAYSILIGFIGPSRKAKTRRAKQTKAKPRTEISTIERALLAVMKTEPWC